MLRPLVCVLFFAAACDGGAAPPAEPPGTPTVLARLGAPGRVTIACGVVADAQGGAWIALDTDADLDGATRGIRDLAIARVDARGAIAWVRQVGAPEVFTRGCALAVDSDQNVYLAGLVNGRGAFGGEPLPSLFTALALSLDAGGAPRWHRLFGEASGESEAMAIAIGPAGDEVQLVGYTRARLSREEAPRGEGDLFVATLAASDGDLRGLRLLGGGGEDLPFGLAATADGLWVGLHHTSGIAGAPLGTELHLLDHTGALEPRGSLAPREAEQPSALATDGALLAVALEAGAGTAAARVSTRVVDRDGTIGEERPIAAADGLRLHAFACARDGRCAFGGRVTGALDGLTPLGADGDGWLRFVDGLATARPIATYRIGSAGDTSTIVRAVAPAPDGSWLIAATTRDAVLDDRPPLGLVDALLLRSALKPGASPGR